MEEKWEEKLRNSDDSYVSANTVKIMPAKVCDLNFDRNCK